MPQLGLNEKYFVFIGRAAVLAQHISLSLYWQPTFRTDCSAPERARRARRIERANLASCQTAHLTGRLRYKKWAAGSSFARLEMILCPLIPLDLLSIPAENRCPHVCQQERCVQADEGVTDSDVCNTRQWEMCEHCDCLFFCFGQCFPVLPEGRSTLG